MRDMVCVARGSAVLFDVSVFLPSCQGQCYRISAVQSSPILYCLMLHVCLYACLPACLPACLAAAALQDAPIFVLLSLSCHSLSDVQSRYVTVNTFGYSNLYPLQRRQPTCLLDGDLNMLSVTKTVMFSSRAIDQVLA